MQLVSAQDPLPAGTLQFANDEDVLARADDVRQTPLVLLNFPKWTDGRAYSQAVLLRGRLRYTGEIRAVGDVVVDMLPLLRRCGFDAAQLRADQDPRTADRTLGFFPRGHYQGDAAGALPRFARATA